MADLSLEQLLDKLRDLRPEFAREGVSSMSLFGSRARRDNRPDSDIDLAIDVVENRKFSLVDLAGVALTVEDHFGVPASIVLRRSLPPSLEKALHREGVKVF